MAAPVLSNQTPTPLQTGFNLARPITLEITDTDADLVAASVKLHVNNVLVWNADAQASGVAVTKTAITNGFRYSIQFTQKQQPAAGTVYVSVYAQDGASNTLSTRYSFVGVNGLHYDDFENGVIDFTINNGLTSATTITESGGRLVIDVSILDNADWFTHGRNQKAALFPLDIADAYNAISVETELNAYTYNTTSSNHTMFVLWKDDFDFVYMGADNNACSMFSGRATGGVWGSLVTFGNVALPVRQRFTWYPSENVVVAEVYGSGGWQPIQSFPNAPKFTHALIAHKEWTSSEIAHAEYNYLSVVGEKSNFTGIDSLASIDAVNIVTAGGPSYQIPGVGEGQAIELVAGVSDAVSTSIEGTVDTLAFPNESSGYVLDSSVLRMGQTPPFNAATPSLDGEGHQHFTLTTSHPTVTSDLLDASVGDWANPTGTGFTGYAKDGFKYTAGVQDVGPVLAPWASEAASANRSSKDGMPNKLLAAVVGPLTANTSGHEVVLFDLDEWASSGSLNVWMRFKPAGSLSLTGDLSSARIVQQAGFFDGLLVMAIRAGTSDGGLNLVDFKSDSQHIFQHVTSSDHWIAASGKTIVNRNDAAGMAVTTTLVGPECRITGANPCGVAVTGSGTNVWIVVATEDGFTLLRAARSGNDTILQAYLDLGTGGPVDTPNVRSVLFDRYGRLWMAEQNKIWCCGHDYRSNVFVYPFSATCPTRLKSRYPHAQLPSSMTITSITEIRDSIYCAVQDMGVFRCDKATMSLHHVFSVAGKRGGGLSAAPPAGEILVGDKATVRRVYGVDASAAGYLAVSAAHGGGSAQLIRVYDDQLMISKAYPDLLEDGSYFAVPLLRS